MGILHYITNGCDNLAATAGPLVAAIGIRMVLSLATIMMVWFGLQEALASAHGGVGFSMGRFLNFVMLMTFAYVMVKYYDSTIPGLSFSLRSLIKDGTNGIVATIGSDTTNNMLTSIDNILSKGGAGMTVFTAPYALVVYVFVQVMLALLSALISAVLAYGAVGSAIVGVLGPIFIPFLVVKQLDFLFWGWFKAFLSFAFYKVVAAATMSILANIYMTYYTNIIDFTHPLDVAKNFPLLILLVLVNLFILLKIPAMTASIFSGHTGGHDAGTGIATGLALRRGL
jgi:hypothetical protein